jgi:curli biogenesis system outer membrane secretion channel CsgG
MRTIVFVSFFLLCVSACTPTESHRALPSADTNSASRPYTGVKAPVAAGAVVNRSAYLTGIFSDGNDRLGAQATQMLVMHLDRSNRFTVLDRVNVDQAVRESQLRGIKQRVEGAKYLITGVVTEFGRREVGSAGLWGVISRSKQQVLHAKVSLSVVDPVTLRVLGSFAGSGEYELSSGEVFGFGSRAGYDGTLADKVLDLCMREAVDRIAEAYEGGVVR